MANAELNLRYFLGDTSPIEVALKRKTIVGGVIDTTVIDLTGSSVSVWVGGASVLCTVDTPANGKVKFRLNSLVTTQGSKPYSIVITYANTDVQTHTKGVIEAVRRSGAPSV